MTRYDGLSSGSKIREFSSKKEAEEWKERRPKKINIGENKGKRMYTIRKTR